MFYLKQNFSLRSLVILFAMLFSISTATMHAMERDHIQDAQRHLVIHTTTPQQMRDQNIYNPDDICPFCQDALGTDRPIIAIHCAPNATTVQGRYHSCHAACLHEWWKHRHQSGESNTCLRCNNVIPDTGLSLIKLNLNSIVRRNQDLLFTFPAMLLAVFLVELCIAKNTGFYQNLRHDIFYFENCARAIVTSFCTAMAINCINLGANNFLRLLRAHNLISDSCQYFKNLIEDLIPYFNSNLELNKFFDIGGVIELQQF
jgi:hypothetical protein